MIYAACPRSATQRTYASNNSSATGATRFRVTRPNTSPCSERRGRDAKPSAANATAVAPPKTSRTRAETFGYGKLPRMNVFNMPSVIAKTLSQVAGTLAQKMSPGQQTVELAKSVLGQKAHDLKLANHTPIGKAMRDHVGDTTNCANYVSAVLVTAGQIPESVAHPHVTTLAKNLEKAGWVEVDAKDAQPGDVVVLQHGGKDAHVELATGHDAKGTLTMIGSNNQKSLNNAQMITENKLTNYWSGVKVLHNPNAKSSGITSNAAVGRAAGPNTSAPAKTADAAVGSGFDSTKKKMVSLGRTQARPAVARRPVAEAPKPASDLENEVARLRAGGGKLIGAVVKSLSKPAATVAAPKAMAQAATTQSAGGPAPKLAEATVTSKTTKEFGPTPWEFNKWIPTNGGKASEKYKDWHAMRDASASLTKGTHELEKATRAQTTAQAEVKAAGTDPKKLKTAQTHLETANKAVDKAEAHVDTAKAAVESWSATFKKYLQGELPHIQARDPEVKTLTTKQHSAEKALAAENKKKTPDAATVTKLQGEIAGAKKAIDARKAAVAKEITDYRPIQEFEKTTYEVNIAGQKVTLTDSAQTYATENGKGLSAHANDGGQKGVDAAVDATNFSAADKTIMKQISQQEGVFSTTESYDRGGVTWGMLQWTTGHDGKGSVISVLDKIKADHPESFKKLFQDYGIDTSEGTLTVTKPDGTKLTGADAVEAVRTDPKLSAAFAVAGTNADVQTTQLALAKSQKIDHDGLDRTTHVKAGGKNYTFSARQIFTSAYGAALVANAGVHAGPGAVSARLEAGLKEFIADNPGLDLAHPEKWAAQAEKAMSDVMIAGDGARAKAYAAAGLSQAAGSYANS